MKKKVITYIYIYIYIFIYIYEYLPMSIHNVYRCVYSLYCTICNMYYIFNILYSIHYVKCTIRSLVTISF